MLDLLHLRHQLHAHPEVAGEEQKTANRVRSILNSLQPDTLLSPLGKTGLAAVYQGRKPGPTILLRCELDALSIAETNTLPYTSKTPGKGHLCGHDGHMTMMLGVAEALSQAPLEKGRIVLLFQPAEEIGAGAKQVIDDTTFSTLEPDFVLALHNIPGEPLGEVLIKPGSFACSSQGYECFLHGKTAHAGEPEKGIPPTPVLAELFHALPELGKQFGDDCLVTIIQAGLGSIAFGTAPGEAELRATLRTPTDELMTELKQSVRDRIFSSIESTGIKLQDNWRDYFPATVNDPQVTDAVIHAAKTCGLNIIQMEHPFRWSEDFGHFTRRYPGVMFGLGSGTQQPALHNPNYDFPDDLLPVGRDLFLECIRQLLAE